MDELDLEEWPKRNRVQVSFALGGDVFLSRAVDALGN
jgi:hypothetical protein